MKEELAKLLFETDHRNKWAGDYEKAAESLKQAYQEMAASLLKKYNVKRKNRE